MDFHEVGEGYGSVRDRDVCCLLAEFLIDYGLDVIILGDIGGSVKAVVSGGRVEDLVAVGILEVFSSLAHFGLLWVYLSTYCTPSKITPYPA